MRFREFSKMLSHNDGTRSLVESTMSAEVVAALTDWQKANVKDCVLVGGLALSFYVRPRFTSDADFLFLANDDIPMFVEKFKRNRPGAFLHKPTHVEIEVLLPKTINMPPEMAKVIFDTANETGGIRIASPSGLVAAKLLRLSYQDKADIEQLAKVCEIDLTPFPLTKFQLEEFDKLRT
jgi:hypothetical protein